MARIIIAPEADADTDGIIAYLAANAGGRVAVKYIDLLDRLYERLIDHPASGALRPALGANIRIGIVSPYIVIYRHSAADSTVTILRIVHGRRRISGNLLTKKD
ncbi:MAG: type II toxin-antitoxin system RelE/ParE family toxin [Gammaproteobacteria bacterium]